MQLANVVNSINKKGAKLLSRDSCWHSHFYGPLGREISHWLNKAQYNMIHSH